jgi:hypothetical protein
MADQTADDAPLVAETSGSQAQMVLQIMRVRGADVSQLDVFEVCPDALVRVQIGSVTGQLFETQAGGRTLGQEGFDGRTAMDRSTVPDHQQLARDVSQQVLEEADYLRATERVVLDAQQQSTTRGDATDNRQVVTGEREAQHWRVAAWGKTADHAGQQGKARLDAPLSSTCYATALSVSSGWDGLCERHSCHSRQMARMRNRLRARIASWRDFPSR